MSDGAAAVWLGRGWLRHARLAPVKHAFAYPAQWLRLRLDGDDAALEAAGVARNRFGIVAVHDADYGIGADLGRPLRDQARAALAAAGIADADGALWLHSFPRVFGYVFNPVSFFFCERADGALRAVIAEVNNTHGERHRYLLAHADGRPIVDGEWLAADKRFAVSPFFGRDGGYRFRFGFRREDGRASAGCVRIELAVDGFTVLVTSLGGSYRPATRAGLALAVLRQPLWTLAVMARIHVQAWRLWRLGLPVRSRADANRAGRAGMAVKASAVTGDEARPADVPAAVDGAAAGAVPHATSPASPPIPSLSKP